MRLDDDVYFSLYGLTPELGGKVKRYSQLSVAIVSFRWVRG